MGFSSCLPPGWLGYENFPVDPDCSCGPTGAPFEFHGAGCDRTFHPYLDDDSLALVQEAVESLVCLRGSVVGDAGAVLSAIASLVAEAQGLLPDVVADAREQDYTWAEIASRLATTTGTVRRRYGDYARWRAGVAVVED